MVALPKILYDIVSTVAPALGTVLLGPFGGTAVRALSGLLLNKPDGTPDEVTRALQTADPATLVRLKELDVQFQEQMATLGLDFEKLANEDRASARQREVSTGDWTPRVLACSTFLGFFGLLSLMAFVDIPTANANVLTVMIGVLGGAISSIISYYYGSSIGSAKKTELLAQKTHGG